jgi:hypothetical protein
MHSPIRAAILALAACLLPAASMAETVVTPIATQYIAALGDKTATSGTGAERWGLWAVDPGPRGVRLSNHEALMAAGGIAPAGWGFDPGSWWLEEHGLIMEAPQFPLPPGRYLVTGDREAQAVLTVEAADATGAQAWSLDNGATIYDVTHLRCRAARYVPQAGSASCSPEAVNRNFFPMTLGAPMPMVTDCLQQDYQVLIVIGMVTGD